MPLLSRIFLAFDLAGNDFFIRHRQRETEDDMRLLLVIDHRMEAMRAINRDQKTVKQPVGPAY